MVVRMCMDMHIEKKQALTFTERNTYEYKHMCMRVYVRICEHACTPSQVNTPPCTNQNGPSTDIDSHTTSIVGWSCMTGFTVIPSHHKPFVSLCGMFVYIDSILTLDNWGTDLDEH